MRSSRLCFIKRAVFELNIKILIEDHLAPSYWRDIWTDRLFYEVKQWVKANGQPAKYTVWYKSKKWLKISWIIGAGGVYHTFATYLNMKTHYFPEKTCSCTLLTYIHNINHYGARSQTKGTQGLNKGQTILIWLSRASWIGGTEDIW